MRLDFSNTWQLCALMYSVFLGAMFRVYYDLLRYVTLKFCKISVVCFLSDIVFFLSSAIATFCFFMLFSKGTIRLFVFCGIFTGFLLCRFTLSRIIAKILAFFDTFLTKILQRAMGMADKIITKIGCIFAKIVNFGKLIEKKR